MREKLLTVQLEFTIYELEGTHMESGNFSEIIKATESLYSEVFNDGNNYTESLVKVGNSLANLNQTTSLVSQACQVLSSLQNSQIQQFLSAAGEQSIRSGFKILCDDVTTHNFKGEINQALGHLKYGRDVFTRAVKKQQEGDWLSWLKNPYGVGHEELRSNCSRAYLASTLICFCYQLIGDRTNVSRAFEESKLYFYYKIYHYCFFKPLDRLNSYDKIGSSLKFQVQSSYDEESVIEEYRGIQLEEDRFLRMTHNIFSRPLPKTLHNDFEIDARSLGLDRHGSSTRYYLSIPWDPPLHQL